MNHHSDQTPVLPYRQRLSYRQARTAVLLGLCIGLLLGIGQVTLDLSKEHQHMHTSIGQLLKVIQLPAAQALHLQDQNQAEQVLTGLFKCQSIQHAALHTLNDSVFLEKTRPFSDNRIPKWLTVLLTGSEDHFSLPLQFDNQPAGRITIAVDTLISAQDLLLRASIILLSNLLAAILLTTILTITFYRILTRPLLQLGQQLAQVDPAHPIRQVITVPPSHQQDELGMMAQYINQALDSFNTALQIHKETETQLKRTQFSMDHAAEMICWTKADGQFIYVNQAVCQTIGYSQAELLTMTVYDINPDLTPEFWNDHWQGLKNNKTGSMESIMRTQTGATLAIEVHFTLLEMDGQEIQCNFAREITSRKTAERAIKRANKILLTLSHGNEAMIKASSEQELLNSICQLIVKEGEYRMVWVGLATTDARQLILPAAQYGFDAGYLETLDITWADTDRGRGPTGTAFRTRKPVISRQIQTDPNFSPWREEAVQRGYASSIALPLPNDDELPLGTINIYSAAPDAFDHEEIQLLENLANNLAFGILKFREAEERRRAQKAKQLSEEKLLTLFHHSPDCLMTLDRHGTIQFSNQKGPNHPQSLLTNIQIPHLQERLNTVFQTGQAVEYPFTNGESAWWEARLAPIFHDGQVTEVLAVCQDVTEKHTLQAQNLRNARLASLGVLSASVAHEINNPNNAIQFNVPILAAIWKDALPILHNVYQKKGAFYLGGMPLEEAMEVVPQLLDGIRMGSERIKTIIGGLKHMIRQDEEILNQKVNIQDPIQSALIILHNQIRQTTDHCVLTPHPIPLWVKGNAQQLEQAFINIIQNALHALTSRTQRLTISLAVDANSSHVLITFHDEGRGIPPEYMERLTDPFFTTKTASGGIGLGLSITRTIIENHAGELMFQSNPDQGTLVTVRLPLISQQPHGKPICQPQ